MRTMRTMRTSFPSTRVKPWQRVFGWHLSSSAESDTLLKLRQQQQQQQQRDTTRARLVRSWSRENAGDAKSRVYRREARAKKGLRSKRMRRTFAGRRLRRMIRCPMETSGRACGECSEQGRLVDRLRARGRSWTKLRVLQGRTTAAFERSRRKSGGRGSRHRTRHTWCKHW